jgi:hypothetical protein
MIGRAPTDSAFHSQAAAATELRSGPAFPPQSVANPTALEQIPQIAVRSGCQMLRWPVHFASPARSAKLC